MRYTVTVQCSIARRCHTIDDQRAFVRQRRDEALFDLVSHIRDRLRREGAVDTDHIDAHTDEKMLGHDEAMRHCRKEMRGREREVSTGASGDVLEES